MLSFCRLPPATITIAELIDVLALWQGCRNGVVLVVAAAVVVVAGVVAVVPVAGTGASTGDDAGEKMS